MTVKRHRLTLLLASFAACVPSWPGAAGAEQAVSGRDWIGKAPVHSSSALVQQLTDPVAAVDVTPPPPLEELIAGLAEDLGAAVHPQVTKRAGELPAEVATALAHLVSELRNCNRVTQSAVPSAGHLVGAPLPHQATAAIQSCSVALRRAVALVEPTLAMAAPHESAGIDAWPVLRYSPAPGSDVYRHDYLLTVDRGGNDLYDNNAGGNVVDLKRGPEGSGAPAEAPARGCETAARDPITGTPPLNPAPDCVASASLVLDLAGNDTYGVTNFPGLYDALCVERDPEHHADPVVRRLGTIGAGFAGVGMVLDRGGNDRYIGKALTQGAGHIGGVGMLEDLGGGNDVYRAVRTAQGTGVLGGVGVLLDDGGNDDYGFYEVRQGLFEVRPPVGEVCDAEVRQLQGAGTLAGLGVLVEQAGNDTYRASRPSIDVFPGGSHRAPSQGAGTFGSVGVLVDLAGHDTYLSDDGRPVVDRGDGRLVGPVVASGGQVEAGLFMDRA